MSLLFFLSILFLFSACYPAPEITTVILVRHADRPEGIDTLNAAGLQRAEVLAKTLEGVDIDEIFSCGDNRVNTTLAPTAQKLKLELKPYNHRELEAFSQLIKEEYVGTTILVGGHSNTVPDMIKFFGAIPPVDLIPADEFDHLYILTYTENTETNLIQLRYGE